MLKRKIILCCVFLIFFVLVIVTGYFMVTPVAKIGTEPVRMYEYIDYTSKNRAYILEKMADDRAFEKLVEETAVLVTDEEINAELEAMGNAFISYDTCKKAILHQKIIEKFASEAEVTADIARTYYENNKDRYGDTVPDFVQVKKDLQMQIGVEQYEKRLFEIKAETNLMLCK